MIHIYTDGATSNNGAMDAAGGWAWVMVSDNQIIDEAYQFEPNTTNNICELKAVIDACEHCEPNRFYLIHSDSNYIIRCYNERWYQNWMDNNWKTSSGVSVKNIDLWKKLIPYFNSYYLRFEKVKAHNGDKWNEYVDHRAVIAKEQKIIQWSKKYGDRNI